MNAIGAAKISLAILVTGGLAGAGFFFYSQTPTGIRRICSDSSTEEKAKASLAAYFQSQDRNTRLLYRNSVENWQNKKRVTWREYYVFTYGSVEKGRSFARDMREKTGLKLEQSVPDEELDKMTTWTGSSLRDYDLKGEQNRLYQECISDKNPFILSDSDKRKYR